MPVDAMESERMGSPLLGIFRLVGAVFELTGSSPLQVFVCRDFLTVK
jgi:hypothetical protein